MEQRRRLRALVPVAGVVLTALLTGASAAQATPAGSIDHVDASRGVERVLFSIDDLPTTARPDMSSVRASVDGVTVRATAVPASQQPGLVNRTAVLVIDSSDSMRGARFAAAKAAALTFVAQAPADVRIGLVTFAGTVSTVQRPTTDRAAVRAAVEGLRLSAQTHLYDGIRAALDAAGKNGQRRLLVLTDGNDTTGSPLARLVGQVRRSGDRVDIVGISVSPRGVNHLTQLAEAGRGTLVNPADPSSLTALFRSEARDLARQVLVSFPVPATKARTSVNLVVSIAAGGQTFADNAYVRLGAAAVVPRNQIPIPVVNNDQARAGVSPFVLYAGAGVIGLALLLGFLMLFGVVGRERPASPEQRLAGYGGLLPPEELEPGPSMRESAVDLTARALSGRNLEAKLREKLEAAGMTLRPAEWLLVHAGVAAAVGVAGFVVGRGNPLLAILALVVGAALPWLYLGRRASRRIITFNSQLPDALQLMAGGLKAGLSFSQSIDTIVREGTEPVGSEFQHATVEARLGVELEDALERVAARMQSADFSWVIMAVRIQRQVGGNLAELFLTVAATLREREFLRRQVRSLSAEGRMSAYVLCGMPPLFLLYLSATSRSMISPLFHTAAGIILLTIAGALMTLGVFWMSRVVKVEV